MSDKPSIPKFRSEQRDFVMDRLAHDIPYADIIVDFRRMYPYFCDPFDADVLDKTLKDRLRTLKSQNSEVLAEIAQDDSQPIIPITSPFYRLHYLDKLLHNTPEVEVVAEGTDSNGNPYRRMKSNRADILKMLSLAEQIFENLLGVSDGKVREEMPKMVETQVLGPPPEQSTIGDSDANSH